MKGAYNLEKHKPSQYKNLYALIKKFKKTYKCLECQIWPGKFHQKCYKGRSEIHPQCLLERGKQFQRKIQNNTKSRTLWNFSLSFISTQLTFPARRPKCKTAKT